MKERQKEAGEGTPKHRGGSEEGTSFPQREHGRCL